MNKEELAKWDIAFTLDGKEYLIECKYDAYSEKSGNVAIEYYNPKSCKPSGLYVTTADLWVIIFHDGIYITSVKTLKNYVENNEPFRNVPCGGDNNSSMSLYKKDEILDVFSQIDNIGKTKFVDIIWETLKQTS